MNSVEAAHQRIGSSEAVGELAHAITLLQETAKLVKGLSERLGRLQEATDDQSIRVNRGLDRLWEASENQSAAVNARLDRLWETTENLAAAVNERLDRLREAADNRSTDIKRLYRWPGAAHTGSAAANERFDLPPEANRDREKLPVLRFDPSSDNPVPDILGAPEFPQLAENLARSEAGQRSLISAASRALVYALVRNIRPQHVVEIGTFRGGTSEIICRALEENGFGVLHTVGPFDSHHAVPVFDSWPDSLRRHLSFYPVTSMDFYYQLAAQRISPEIALVDGDHSYEATLFDIQSLAKRLARGGFLLIDNVSQAGPYYAAMDFLQQNPDWRRCTAREPQWADPRKAFDRERTSIPETDFEILRAPRDYRITSRPVTLGELPSPNVVRGLRLIANSGGGTLHAQCVLRGFGESMAEEVTTAVVEIAAPGEVDLLLPQPVSVAGRFTHCTVEPWLAWTGEAPLALAQIPAVIA